MPHFALIAAALVAAMLLLLVGAWAFWRFYWFWRNPSRTAPSGMNVVSPADGTVVYVKRAEPREPIVCCKQGQSASINDIACEDLEQPRILIGIFMSPFSVHYNRAPWKATIGSSRQYPAKTKNWHMTSMHWRCMMNWLPIEVNSPHIVENNRAVTRFDGELGGAPFSYYVVQIGGGGVHGIDVFTPIGGQLEKGETFGMIRIGSQVDLIVPDLPGFEVCVRPGDRVTAGETILIRVA